jgi:hypothetical protein
MTFFQKTFGFSELPYLETQRVLAGALAYERDPFHRGFEDHYERTVFGFENANVTPLCNGTFVFDTVAELRQTALRLGRELGWGPLHFHKKNVVGESRALHTLHPNALFQAASQFNCLEFADPDETPEEGITGYEEDNTQGPACAMACASGTALRNYLVPVTDDGLLTTLREQRVLGQTTHRQLQALTTLSSQLTHPLFNVRNGYINLINKPARNLEQAQELIDTVRVGCQFDTEVTDVRLKHHAGPLQGKGFVPQLVSQVYASACSVGYSKVSAKTWRPLAQLVLKAAYEATFYAYLIHCARCIKSGRKPGPLFLTQVGGGVFRNPVNWICEAMEHAERQTLSLWNSQKCLKRRHKLILSVCLVHKNKVQKGFETFIDT